MTLRIFVRHRVQMQIDSVWFGRQVVRERVSDERGVVSSAETHHCRAGRQLRRFVGCAIQLFLLEVHLTALQR